MRRTRVQPRAKMCSGPLVNTSLTIQQSIHACAGGLTDCGDTAENADLAMPPGVTPKTSGPEHGPPKPCSNTTCQRPVLDENRLLWSESCEAVLQNLLSLAHVAAVLPDEFVDSPAAE